MSATGHFADVGPDRMRSIMEVNFFGLTETTRVCLPLLRQGVTPAVVKEVLPSSAFTMPSVVPSPCGNGQAQLVVGKKDGK